MRQCWSETQQDNHVVDVQDLITFSCENLKHPKATPRTRTKLTLLLLNLLNCFVIPNFDDYVMNIYSRTASLDDLPRMLRAPSGRQIGSTDPGNCLFVILSGRSNQMSNSMPYGVRTIPACHITFAYTL